MAWPGMFKKLFANDGAGPFLRADILPVMTSSASGIGRPDGSTLKVDASGVFSAASILPVGFIGMWSGAIVSIPTGWALCDGQNGTPNLRDRFIVGAGATYAPGATGGGQAVTPTGAVSATTLAEWQMPVHNHAVPMGSVGSAGYNSWPGLNQAAGAVTWHDYTTYAGSNGAHTHGLTLNAMDIRPYYYALAFIMKL